MSDFYELVSTYILEANAASLSSVPQFDHMFDTKEDNFEQVVKLFTDRNLKQWPLAQNIFPIVQDTFTRQNASKLKPYIDVFPIIDLLWYIAEGHPAKQNIFNLSINANSPNQPTASSSSSSSSSSTENPAGPSTSDSLPTPEEVDKMSPAELRDFLNRMLS